MSKKDTFINKELLREIFDYKDGHLYWKIKTGPNAVIGKKAGCYDASTGYYKARVNGLYYRIHRLVFMYHYGYIPKMIDHIDNNKCNNKIENLREATHAQNQQNSGISKLNTSGFKGVHFDKGTGKWMAKLQLNKKAYYLGLFKTSNEAAEVIKTERERLHKEFARHE